MRTGLGAAAAVLALLASTASPSGASAQHPPLRIHSGVSPDTVTVGEPFTSVVRIMAPPGSIVRFSGVAVGDSIQPVDTVRVIGAAADSGATASYRLVGWVAARVQARAQVRVAFPDGTSSEYEVPLAVPVVQSVLPAGELPPPRPGRGVVPVPARPLWPWIAASLAVLILAAILFGTRRRAARERAGTHPRAAALADLQALDGQMDPRATHERATRILRRYLAATDPKWGEEWTTTELLLALRGSSSVDRAGVAELSSILDRADRVKFAGRASARDESLEFVRAVRGWIASYPPVDETVVRHGEAA